MFTALAIPRVDDDDADAMMLLRCRLLVERLAL